MKKRILSLSMILTSILSVHADGLKTSFQTPPDSARPGVYWYFLDGNQNRDAMVADLHAMHDVGIGSVTDIPMCEFWYGPHDTQYGVIEAVSIANTMGRDLVRAEAFTSSVDSFAKYPGFIKKQTDWALAIGINGFMFHTYAHQPLGPEAMPGMTFGRYGIHWHRNQPFWDMLPDYHQYIARSSHLLRQGEAVADILYLTPEGAPHIFEAPADATEGETRWRDKKATRSTQ